MNKPLPAALALGAIGGGVRNKHESLTEPALGKISSLSEPDEAANNHEDRHVLDSCLVGKLQSGRRRSGVCLVDNLAVERLHLVVCRRHLVNEDLLDSVSIGNCVSVEEDR